MDQLILYNPSDCIDLSSLETKIKKKNEIFTARITFLFYIHFNRKGHINTS